MDMKKLMQIMQEGEKPKKLGDKDLRAKMDVLKELHQLATKKAGSSIKDGLSKVTVASNDKDGLKEGLKKAEELLETPEELDLEDSDMEDSSDEDLEDMDEEMIEDDSEEDPDMDMEEVEEDPFMPEEKSSDPDEEKKRKLKELLGL